MKYSKIFIMLLLLIGMNTLPAIADETFPQEFINAFENCTPHTWETPSISMFGVDINAKHVILGPSGNYCGYKNYSGPANYKDVTQCYFTKPQIEELVWAMRNSGDSTSPISVSLSESKATISGGNTATRVWAKYLNNSSICETIYAE